MAGSLEITEKAPQQSTIIACVSPEKRLAEAYRMAAAALCTSSGKRPCGVCRDCRKVQQRIHPDVTLVTRQDKKKELIVDQVREITREAYILPNEAERRVFILEEADLMNISAQNAALKLLEEPPNGAVFLLCAASARGLLETVRSRCAVITLNEEAAAADDGQEKAAAEYLKLVATRNEPGLVAWCASREEMNGADFTALLERIRALTVDVMCGRKKAEGADPAMLLATERLMDRCLVLRRSNVSGKMILGYLATNPAIEENRQ